MTKNLNNTFHISTFQKGDGMVRKGLIVGCAAVALALVMMGCPGKNPVTPPAQGDAAVPTPTGATVMFSDGFGTDLLKW
jgi:hypothetical protein